MSSLMGFISLNPEGLPAEAVAQLQNVISTGGSTPYAGRNPMNSPVTQIEHVISLLRSLLRNDTKIVVISTEGRNPMNSPVTQIEHGISQSCTLPAGMT